MNIEKFNALIAAQSTVDQTLSTTVPTNPVRILSRFGKGKERIPWYIRTGPMSQGEPTRRKRYRYLEFQGEGSVDVRVYVDNRVVARGRMIAIETPNHLRRLNLPRSCWGYALDIEMAGDAELFAVSVKFDGMPSES